MATLTAQQALDMGGPVSDLLDYAQPGFTSTLIRLEDDATHYIEFYGTGFKIGFGPSGPTVTDGVITGIKAVDGTDAFEVTGANMSAAEFYTLAEANDRDGLLGTLFSGNDLMTGSAAADSLRSYAGKDTLNGGAGKDTLAGGGGNDTYVVTTGDVIIEKSGQGTDLVRSGGSWTLAANVENLVLTGSAGISGTGNGAANVITGNAAGNVLRGYGGADTLVGGGGADTLDGGLGADSLAGGLGADVFHFGGAIAPNANVDKIKDFAAGTDTLRLDNDVFAGLAAGDLADAAFASGAGLTGGQDADDRIVHDTTTGTLYYDADGNGSGAAVAFAKLMNGAAVTAADFLIVE